jgi:hypothetical protein
VIFTNLTDQEILIPAGTVVNTLDPEPIRFTTTTDKTIPAGSQNTRVSIIAEHPGSTGNVPALSILAIEGPLGLNLTVNNTRPTVGGDDRAAPAPSADDYQELYDQLFESLTQTALEEIAARLGPDDLLISKQAELKYTLEEIYTPVEPAPTDELNLILRLELQALTVSGAHLQTLGRSALEANIPAGFAPHQETLEIEILDEPTLDTDQAQTARWSMRAQWQVSAQLESAQAIKFVLGLEPNQASEHLSQALSLSEPAQISLTPAWWPRLPILPFRISVEGGQ